jgi:hypothetical protein
MAALGTVKSIRAFGTTPGGNFEVYDYSSLLAGAAEAIQRLSDNALKAKQQYVSDISGDAGAKVGVLLTGQDLKTQEVQFAPNANVTAAFDAVIAAYASAKAALDAIDFPTA